MLIKNQVEGNLGLNQRLSIQHETYGRALIVEPHRGVRVQERHIRHRLYPPIEIKVLAEESDVPALFLRSIVTGQPSPNVAQALPVVSHRLGHLNSSPGDIPDESPLGHDRARRIGQHPFVQDRRHLVSAYLGEQGPL